MARYIAFDAVFFFLPFALYAAWLVFTRGSLKNLEDWQIRTIAYLTIAGSGLLLGTILILTSFNQAPAGGTYVPAHIENGVIVPAHVVPAPAPGK
jgi:hypothetical protein